MSEVRDIFSPLPNSPTHKVSKPQGRDNTTLKGINQLISFPSFTSKSAQVKLEDSYKRALGTTDEPKYLEGFLEKLTGSTIKNLSSNFASGGKLIRAGKGSFISSTFINFYESLKNDGRITEEEGKEIAKKTTIESMKEVIVSGIEEGTKNITKRTLLKVGAKGALKVGASTLMRVSSKVAGGAAGAAIDTAVALSDGKLTARELVEIIGSAIGGVAGGLIGGAIGGPAGGVLAGAAGSEIGKFVAGKLYDRFTR